MKTAHQLVAEYWYHQALRKHLFNHCFQFAFDIQVFKQSKELNHSYLSYLDSKT